MHIKEIIVDGFKSYAQRTVIDGFDPHFNAITGLNGSGKSNILDSICFVLGITNLSQVRAGNLSELVYKQGQAGVQKAVVTLVFHNDDPAQAPIGYESCPTVTVTRQVWLGGKSKYWINGKQAAAMQVQNLFQSVQLNVNNPHFLIMQGRITKVLGMRPPEILGLLEEAAGTRLYETKKKYSIQTIAKKQQKLDELNSILNERITPTLERLRGEKQSYLQWSKNQADLERLERFVVAADYHRAMQSLNENAGAEERKALMAAEYETTEHQEALRAKQNEIAEYTDRLKGDFEESHAAAKQVEEKESKQLVKVTAKWQNAKESLSRAQADHEATKQVLQDTRDTLEQQQTAHETDATSLQSLHEAAQKAQAKVEQLAQDMQNWSAGVATSTDDNVGSLPAQISKAYSEAQNAQASVKQGEMRLKHLKKELKAVSTKLKSQTKSAERLRNQETKAVEKVETLNSKMLSLDFNAEEYQSLEQRHVDLSALVEELTGTVDTLSAQLEGRLSFVYKDPVRGFDRSKVKGLVAKLVTTIPDTKYSTALEVVAGGRLFQVVVDEAITGKALLERGQLVRRVTIIPLDKIRAKHVPTAAASKAADIAKKHKAEAYPAIELIGFDESVRQAMEYVFGASLIVDNGTAANEICETTKTRTVTLDGDVYDPSGTIAGGSKNQLGTTLLQLTQLRDAQKELGTRQQELDKVSKDLEQMQTFAGQYEDVSSKLDLAQAELATIRKNLSQTTFGMLSDQKKSMEDEIDSVTKECESMSVEYKTKTELYERLQSQKEELSKEREASWTKMQNDFEEAKKEAATQTQLAREAESQSQTMSMELESLQAEVSAAEEAVRVALKAVEEASTDEADLQIQVASVRATYDEAKARREDIEKDMTNCSAELVRLNRERGDLAKAVEDVTLKAKKLSVALARLQKDQEQATKVVASMTKKFPWIETEKEAFGVPGGDYDFEKTDPEEASRELKRLQNETESLSKKVNKKVMSMIEKAEGEYTELLRKRKVVENDKKKIQAVIEELDVQKKAELDRTWQKVNRDFGSIFSTLLPGARAKLEPPEGQEAWEGLEVKVAFGEVWKESLSELSGGQRSLLALSLILSLLLFKPAPMYILDEVDAALDLSHTQNIGNMLKTHFSQSQFIVVSLKEGMFNNANVVFRTKFIDGVSTVSRTIGVGSSRVRALADQNRQSLPDTNKSTRRSRAGEKENAMADD